MNIKFTDTASVMISIQPYFVFLIIAKAMGWEIEEHKQVEVRKNYPRLKDWDRKVIIYCSKNKKSFASIPEKYQSVMRAMLGKVIGEFKCGKVYLIKPVGNAYRVVNGDSVHTPLTNKIARESCLNFEQMENYLGRGKGYGWKISGLKVYDEAKELSDYRKPCVNSWYCESCALYNAFLDRCGNTALMMKRPPQSWCYVKGR